MKVYFWGLGQRFYHILDKYKANLLYEIDAFIDSDVSKQRELFGKPILCPSKAEVCSDDLIVITSDIYFDNIASECSRLWGLHKVCNGNGGGYQSLEEFIAEKIITAEWLPEYIGIDASTACQLNCTACYMRLGNNGVLGTGNLRFDDFKKIVDDNPQIKHIELSNNGEIFLNPEIKRIIEYAYINDVMLYARNGVNMNYVPDDVLETLVLCKFREIQISLDGASQETYVKYRKGGDFNKVLENIRKINRYKYRYNSSYPKLYWQFIVMPHNELDVREAKYLANELDMEMQFKSTWEKDFVPQYPEMLKRETGSDFIFDSSVEYNDTSVYGNILCRQIFKAPRINWDGRLIGCCALYKKTFNVNVFEVGLKKALTTPEYMAAKRALMGEIQDIDFPCRECIYYQNIVKTQNFIKPQDLMEISFIW